MAVTGFFQLVRTEVGRTGRPQVLFGREETAGGPGSLPQLSPQDMLQQSQVLSQVGNSISLFRFWGFVGQFFSSVHFCIH